MLLTPACTLGDHGSCTRGKVGCRCECHSHRPRSSVTAKPSFEAFRRPRRTQARPDNITMPTPERAATTSGGAPSAPQPEAEERIEPPVRRQRRHRPRFVPHQRALEIELGPRALAYQRVENHHGQPDMRQRFIRSLLRQAALLRRTDPDRSDGCLQPNGHRYCDPDEPCECICHTLDNAEIGWYYDELTALISELEYAVGPTTDKADWVAAAVVLAVWKCGTDPVRISHAIGKHPTMIHAVAERLRAAGIWDGDMWHAKYVEDDASDPDLLEFSLHCLVAEGRIVAEKHGDEFLYCTTKFGPSPRTPSARSRRAERRSKV